jgi:hypothetical protein
VEIQEAVATLESYESSCFKIVRLSNLLAHMELSTFIIENVVIHLCA